MSSGKPSGPGFTERLSTCERHTHTQVSVDRLEACGLYRCWNELHLPLQKPLLQQDQLPRSNIRPVGRLVPAECSHYTVCVADNQLTAAVTIYHAHTDTHIRDGAMRTTEDLHLVSGSAAAGFTDVTDEDDFGVGRNVLGEQWLLVLGQRKFVLTG